ncbi:NADPH-dependent FMN reductase [Neisseria sp. 23W00296]|uniref:NADPH-dependent FMN reductase n=1 Tax=unclassified Neisseria TaxID=2623750 RepID=UPI0002A22A39|nr:MULTISPECIES: NAD(P)H-dependent oxidoreductase [unclassified Neisseria]EKY04734.1 hypothetical protein HMPREF9120_02143 [Neisseria sp. oral taxon 020 str. F0370]
MKLRFQTAFRSALYPIGLHCAPSATHTQGQPKTRIALIIGSLSRPPLNRSVAEYIAAQAPDGVEIEEIAIADLPLYTQDLDKQSVPAYDPAQSRRRGAHRQPRAQPQHPRRSQKRD